MTTELTKIEQEISEVVRGAKALNIISTEHLREASETREWLKEKIKFIKNHKEVLYRPYKDKIDAINEVYKPFEKMLTETEKAISSAMSAYQTAVLKAKQEAEAKIASRVGEGKGKIKITTALAKMEALESPVELEGTGFTKKQILVITDISKIPQEYMMPNEIALEFALKKGAVIPGASLEIKLIPKSR